MVANKKASSRQNKAKQPAAEKRAPLAHANAKPNCIATLDRRAESDRRAPSDRRKQILPVGVEHRAIERRAKVNRRRQIDPTTCERDYTPDEIEFMGAMDEYKRRNGRMFPTCSEVLEVVKSLGYQKIASIDPPAMPAASLPVAAAEAVCAGSV